MQFEDFLLKVELPAVAYIIFCLTWCTLTPFLSFSLIAWSSEDRTENSTHLQGFSVAYVDNANNAKNFVPAAIETLGKDLGIMDDGRPVPECINDVFHVQHRMTEAMNESSPFLKRVAGEAHLSV